MEGKKSRDRHAPANIQNLGGERQLSNSTWYNFTPSPYKEPVTIRRQRRERPSIIQRPHSMMMNRSAQLLIGSTANVLTTGNLSPRNRPVLAIPGHQDQSNPTAGHQSNPTAGHQGQSNLAAKLQSTLSIVYRLKLEGSDDVVVADTFHMRDKERLSASSDSLDETNNFDTSDLELDPDLSLKPDEPDSWSSTADKKLIKKLSKKDIKRQENIFEFIQTEKNHLTTLKIMQRVYARGLAKELNTDPTTLSKLFPLIDEHVDFTSLFIQKLTSRQNSRKVVSGIGDILLSHWEGENGEKMKKLFGDFCSKQNEITMFYKDLMKNDKKFHSFMKKYDKIPLTRRQDIPACALLITQRLTKYPILLQTMLENSNTKDHKQDYDKLERALKLSREIAKDVDEQVQAYQRQQLLKEICDNIEAKSTTTFKENHRFDRNDLLRPGRKLLYSAVVQWSVKESKKYTDIFFLLLSDCIVFLQENNAKYTFASGQPAAVPLQKMIVREVANDEKSLYLMSMSTQQMYTIKLSTDDQCKTLTHAVRLAISNCHDEDEGRFSDDESEIKVQDPKLGKAKQLVSQLEMTDERINKMLEERICLFKSLAECVDRGDAVAGLRFAVTNYAKSSVDENGFIRMPPGSHLLNKAIDQLKKLTHAFYRPTGLSRHRSSVGEHGRSAKLTTSLPKRSDTFGGFDKGKESKYSGVKLLNATQSETALSEAERNKSGADWSDHDSGLMDAEPSLRSDSRNSLQKGWDLPPNEGNSRDDVVDNEPYLPPTTDQVTALTTMAQLLSEYQSFAVQQDTHMERLQLQLEEHEQVQTKKKPTGALQEAELKRNKLKQQEQMDALRKEQQQFRVEREQWQKQTDRFQRHLDNERREIEEEKRRLWQVRQENEKERAESGKELSRIRDLQRNTQRHLHSSSYKPSKTSLNKNNNNSIHGDAHQSEVFQRSSCWEPSYNSLHTFTYLSATDHLSILPGNRMSSTVLSLDPSIWLV